MREIFLILTLCLGSMSSLSAQTSFPGQCTGVWKGTMYMYGNGVLRDSVAVRFTVSETPDANVYHWKTEYLSEKLPMVKAYKLRLADAGKKIYIIDEGDGLELKSYLFGNKLYSIFETSGVFLTSSYELIDNNTLIFEVTSGKKFDETKGVTNYSVNHLQRVIFKKTE